MIEILDPILQRHVEEFYRKNDELNGEGASVFARSGNAVRAAISCGILKEPNGDVGDMKPGLVLKVAKAVGDAIAEATKIPPD